MKITHKKNKLTCCNTDTVAYSGTNSLEIVGTRDNVVPNWSLVESGVTV
ncbi:MAG: hypothetical protein HQ515_21600 [Phycisphaeraceae bacterium]|nr:hypothetical protein [Phycisphaeraceae bacterium]